MEMKKPVAIPKISATVPIGIARSALFGAGTKSKNGPENAVPILPLRNAVLKYSGPRLNQHHALLWQAIIHVYQGGSWPEDRVVVGCDTLLRLMGRKPGDHSQRKRVWRYIKDLLQGQIEYTTTSHQYCGALLFEAAREINTKRRLLSIRINPNLKNLLSSEVLDNDLARKAALGQNMLAMWLHDYIGTHYSEASSRPVIDPLDRLRVLSGSSLQPRQFRHRIGQALVVLKEQPNPLVLSWKFDGDRLVVFKAPTRHIMIEQKSAQKLQAGAAASDRQEQAAQQARDLKADGPL